MNSLPVVEILTVGNEILTGSVLNGNAAFLGKELNAQGFEVRYQSSCPDQKEGIYEALRTAMRRAQITIVTGGLGPTPDDVTRDSVAGYFQVPLVFSKTQFREIAGHYRKRGKKVPSLVKREAYFPANAVPLINQFGIALGFSIEERGRLLFVLPGVPGELIRLFSHRVLPFLKRRFPGIRARGALVVKTIGVSEAVIMRRLKNKFFQLGSFDFGIYPESGEVSLRLYARETPVLRRVKKYITQRLKDDIYTFRNESIEEVVGRCLSRRRGLLAVAESCTGGGLSQRIVRCPGASRYFLGSVVAYQNRLKISELDVSKRVLRKKGAVSKETAIQMAEGVRKRFKSTLGLSVTGIAGPTGGTQKKPVGLVCFGLVAPGRSLAWQDSFYGDREQVQERAVKKALEYLWRWVR